MYTEDDTCISQESSLNSSHSSGNEDEIRRQKIKNVMGSDDDENDKNSSTGKPSPSDEVKQFKTEFSASQKDILGSDLSGSSSTDSDSHENTFTRSEKKFKTDRPISLDLDEDNDVDADDRKSGDELETEEVEETKIAVDFPYIKANLGNEVHLVKMPNFLSVDTRPFDAEFYENEQDNSEVLDEEGRTRLKLKVENTIRWRLKNKPNEDATGSGDGQDNAPEYESNARIVKWSDGSMSLHLGDEIFDIHTVDIQSDYNHLFIREGSGLQAQTVFKDKLTFRPHSTDSFTHRKITKSLVDKTNKTQKVKILPVAGADPESNRLQMIKKEEEKLRATLRRESQQRRMRERQMASAASRGKSHYEDDFIDDGNTFSISAAKQNARARKNVSAVYSSDESESLSDISETEPQASGVTQKRARVIEDDSE